MREFRIPIYRFDELDDEAKNIATTSYLEMIRDNATISPFAEREDVQKALAKCQEMQTPWFFTEYLMEENATGIQQELRDYEYFAEGIPACRYGENQYRTLCAVNTEGNMLSAHTHTIRLLNANIDIEDAIKNASKEYAETAEGKEVITANAGHYGIDAFMLTIPNQICQNHGFEKTDTDYDTITFASSTNLI